MELSLSYALISSSYGICLYVINMGRESCLNATWTAKSDLFQGQSVIVRPVFYTREKPSWGYKAVKSKVKLYEVYETVSHTKDVWVKFV